ncbi:hypothetical protein EYF80_002123 [Liparis tanakae]|uniref:Uncharacterized protein n=1 Tax=Liparis tanakae TaxID=230148 RepID=A0A4Z2JC51_9TELE|nr:hypothetical protein EYF80_002123 [Liparis tanakae]
MDSGVQKSNTTETNRHKELKGTSTGLQAAEHVEKEKKDMTQTSRRDMQILTSEEKLNQQRPDLEAFGLDPEFEFGVDVAVAFLVHEHPVAVLFIPLDQGLEDFVVFTPGHGLGLPGVPVRPQAPVLKFPEHLRPSARRLGRLDAAVGTPAPRLVLLVVGGGGGSHRVRHTAGFPRCHDETRESPMCCSAKLAGMWVRLGSRTSPKPQ